jgi:hypothetical protein
VHETPKENRDVSKHVAVEEQIYGFVMRALFCFVREYFKQNAGFDHFKAVFRILSQST